MIYYMIFLDAEPQKQVGRSGEGLSDYSQSEYVAVKWEQIALEPINKK